MSEAQKQKAKRIVVILRGYGVLDNHYKGVIQTKESWENALTKAITQIETEVWYRNYTVHHINTDKQHGFGC